MPQKLLRSLAPPGVLIRAIAACSLMTFMTFAAAPSLGTSDVPELPKGDGTGDTPDMFIKLVPGVATPGAKSAESVKLSSLRGKVVLLDLFVSWCPHCQEHAPHVVDIYNQYRQRGFTVLGLASDNPDKVEDVKKFMRNAKVNYPVGFLTTEVIAYYSDTNQVPQMILFGADGKMAKRLVGWTPQIEQELKQAIDAQIAKLPTVKPGSKASSKPSPKKMKQA